jgi:uncharacterized repeat protein (TIGR01451 family)
MIFAKAGPARPKDGPDSSRIEEAMTIKRLGVQLAGSGLVIVLGALGVTQAQRDSQKTDTAEWDIESPPAMGPPVPIAAASDEPHTDYGQSSASAAASQPAYSFGKAGATGIAGSEPGNVRQVRHEETFSLPTETYEVDDQPASAGPTGFALPAWSAGGGTAPADAPTYQSPDQAPSPYGFAGQPAAAAPGYGFSPPGSVQTYENDDAYDDEDDVAVSAPGGYSSPGGYSAPAMIGGAAAIGAVAINAIGSNRPQVANDNPPAPNNYAGSPSDAGASASPAASGPVNGLRSGGFEPAPTTDAFAQVPRSLPTEEAEDGDDESAEAAAGQAAPGDLYAAPYQSEAALQTLEPSAAQPQPTINQFAAAPQYPATAESAPASRTVIASEPVIASVPIDSAAAASAAAVMAAAAPAARIASTSTALTSLADVTIDDELVINEPGDRRLEGMQAPSIVIHKRAPDQVKVGKPATFIIQVQNVGGVEAFGVQVHDRVPAGMRLVDATPQPQVHGDLLLWKLGAVEPGGERTISMQLVPEAEGELGSVARVTFEAAASVRTFSTRPALKITQRAPERVLIGQQVEIELEVSNPGSGAATGVILQTDVPDGLEHPKGRQLDNLIGTLAPGESRRQVLRLRAITPGMVQNEVRLVSDDDLSASDSIALEVISPELAIELEGPSRRFLERQATYQINLANVGSAEATNVEIIAYLDRGFSFVGTEYQGQYDPTRHAVYWSLAELPPDGRGSVPLTLLPIEKGERAIRLEARGDLNLIAKHEKRVNVDALAELTFSITDDADPIEVGSEATYEIKLTNRGSREDGDVNLKLQLPPGLELVSSESDASTDGRGLVVFAPQSAMAARSETIHRVRVRGTAPGTHVVKAIVASREAPTPVTKEESTTVYSDQ